MTQLENRSYPHCMCSCGCTQEREEQMSSRCRACFSNAIHSDSSPCNHQNCVCVGGCFP